MPKKTKARELVSRYSTKAATLQVEMAMGRSRPVLTNREMAAQIGLKEDVFSRKINLSRSSFSLEEFGAIADFFNAPVGWPMLPADVKKVE